MSYKISYKITLDGSGGGGGGGEGGDLALLSAVAGADAIRLSWDFFTAEMPSHTGFTIEKYNGVTYDAIATVGTGIFTYVDNSGIAPLTEHQYRVQVLPTGEYSNTSAQFSGETATPTNLELISIVTVNVTVGFDLDVSYESGFVVERKQGAAGTFTEVLTLPAGARSFTDAVPTGGVSFYYRIRAVYNEYTSGYSTELEVPVPALGNWDLKTAVLTVTSNPNWSDVGWCGCFNPTGTLLWVASESSGSGEVRAFSVSPAYTLPAMLTRATGNDLSQTNVVGNLRDLVWSADGLRYWLSTALVASPTNLQYILEYTVTVPFTQTGKTLVASHEFGEAATWQIRSFQFNEDGTKLFVLRRQTASIIYGYVYNLSTPYDISTRGAAVSTRSMGATDVYAGVLSTSGDRLFILNVNNEILTYELSVPWNLSGPLVHTKDLTVDGINFARTMIFQPNGARMFVIAGSTQDRIYQYQLALG